MFHEHVRKFLEPYQLTEQQFNVLRILRGAQPDALSTGDVKARMIDTTCDISRLVARMQKKGLIHKSESAADRRLVELSISTAGLALLKEIDTGMSEVKNFLDELDDTEICELSQTLEKVLISRGVDKETIASEDCEDQ